MSRNIEVNLKIVLQVQYTCVEASTTSGSEAREPHLSEPLSSMWSNENHLEHHLSPHLLHSVVNQVIILFFFLSPCSLAGSPYHRGSTPPHHQPSSYQHDNDYHCNNNNHHY